MSQARRIRSFSSRDAMGTVEGMTVTDWLLDSDPAIRWQVLRDVLAAPAEEVAAERARVAEEGWGARLLDLQASDGQWAGGTYYPPPDDAEQIGQPWTATAFSLKQLVDFGVDPQHERARRAVALVRENSRWEHDGERFFDGEVEPCINGLTVVIGAHFGEDVGAVVDRLLTEQLQDGGWNCAVEDGSTRGSFHTTIAVLEGLLAFETAAGPRPDVTVARERGQEYLLEREFMRRISDGEIPDERWLQFSYPTRWRYDVLRALDYLRDAGAAADPRMDAALDLVESKRDAEGRWPLENTHPGAVHFRLEDGDGHPSRWNTLRALRVLALYR